MYLLLNRWTQHLQTLQVHRSHDIKGTGQCVFLLTQTLNVKVKKKILVNASPSKSLVVATFNFAGASVT